MGRDLFMIATKAAGDPRSPCACHPNFSGGVREKLESAAKVAEPPKPQHELFGTKGFVYLAVGECLRWPEGSFATPLYHRRLRWQQ